MQWIKTRISRDRGRDAELRACKYLRKQGLTLIEQNYHCRGGEIDLIMQEGAELVFIEVKFRANQSHGKAEEFFHQAKRRKFEKAVSHYMHSNQLNPAHVPFRIDVVAINQQDISWFKHV